jgi:hypothetical protein
MVDAGGRMGMVNGFRRPAEVAVLAAAVAASVATSFDGKSYSRPVDVNVGPRKAAVLRATLSWDASLSYNVKSNGNLILFDGAALPTPEGLALLETSAGDAQAPGVGQRLEPALQYVPDSGSPSTAEYDVEVTDHSDRRVNDDPLRPPHWASYLTLFNPTDETVSASVEAVSIGSDFPVLERVGTP